MAEIDIEELGAHASRVVDEVANGASYVVTRRGRPTAAIVPIEDAQDLVLADTDEFERIRQVAREDHRQGRSTKLGN
jgi:prevent-host-death family protein